MTNITLTEQLGRDTSVTQVYDFSVPHWPAEEPAWRRRLRELEARSAGLDAEAGRQLAQADAVSVLRGIGLAILAMKAELEAQELRRD
jgi:hypothetical protein